MIVNEVQAHVDFLAAPSALEAAPAPAGLYLLWITLFWCAFDRYDNVPFNDHFFELFCFCSRVLRDFSKNICYVYFQR